MSRPYAAYTIIEATPTSTGTQDYTVSGVGSSPVGCVVVAVRAASANAATGGLGFSWGVADGTNTYCTSVQGADNVGTSDVTTSTTTDLIRILDDVTKAEEVVGEFDSFITNGVRINFTTVDTSQYLFYIILYFGSDCETFAFFADPPTTVDTSVNVNTGFEASYVLTSNAGPDTVGTVQNQLQAFFGVAVNDGLDTSCSAACLARDNEGTSVSRRGFFDDRLSNTIRVNTALPDVVGGNTTIEDYDSSGFEVYSRTANNGGNIIGLAVRVPSSLGVSIQTTQTFESATGNSTRSGFGSFLPGLWYALDGANSTLGYATFGAVSIGIADGRLEQFSGQVCSQHNSGTTNEQVAISNRDIHALRGNNGVSLQVGEISSRAVGSYDVNVTVVDATPRLYHMLIVEELPFLCDTVVALPAMGASITAEQLFDATITASLPAMNAQLDAEQLFDATIDLTFGAASASITAEVQFNAVITAGLPAITASLTAELQLDAVINAGLPAVAAELDAELQLDAVIAAGLPALSASLTAELQLDAVIGAIFASMSATIVADREAFAVITAGLPALQAALEAELDQNVDAVINAGLAAMSADIQADSLIEVQITAGLPAANADLDVDQLFDATIAAGLPAADSELEADVSSDATIAAGLSSVSADLTAELIFDAVINAGLPAMSAELFDYELLGCDVALLGSKSQIVALLGSSDVTVGLSGSSNVRDALLGSSDQVVDLDASSDRIIDLGGSHC